MAEPDEVPARIKVFLLDDHEVVRRGLKDLLESDGDIEVVGESGSAAEATRRIRDLEAKIARQSPRPPAAMDRIRLANLRALRDGTWRADPLAGGSPSGRPPKITLPSRS